MNISLCKTAAVLSVILGSTAAASARIVLPDGGNTGLLGMGALIGLGVLVRLARGRR